MDFSPRQTDQKRKGSDGTPSLILVATGIKLEKMLASIAGTWIMSASVGGSPQAVWPPQDPAPPAEVIFFIGAGFWRAAVERIPAGSASKCVSGSLAGASCLCAGRFRSAGRLCMVAVDHFWRLLAIYTRRRCAIRKAQTPCGESHLAHLAAVTRLSRCGGVTSGIFGSAYHSYSTSATGTSDTTVTANAPVQHVSRCATTNANRQG